MAQLFYPAGTAAKGPYALDIDPVRAGWTYSGLRVLELTAGDHLDIPTGTTELAVMPLAGGCRVERHRQEECRAENAEQFPHHHEA